MIGKKYVLVTAALAMVLASSVWNTKSYLHIGELVFSSGTSFSPGGVNQAVETSTLSAARRNDDVGVGAQPMKKSRFDPFADLTFESMPIAEQQVESGQSFYSSYHCVGTGTQDPDLQTEVGSIKNARRPNYVSRSCYYRNLYYRPADQTFHYYSDEVESNMWDEAKAAGNESFHELQSRMNVSMSHVEDVHFQPYQFEKYRIGPWRPTLHQHEHLPLNTTMVRPSNAHFLLYMPYHGSNLGHLIWDDFLSLFSLLDLFHKGEDPTVQPVPFFVELSFIPKRRGIPPKNYGGSDPLWRCSPNNHAKWNKCVKNHKRAFPSLMGINPDECSGDLLRTGNWLLGDNIIGQWKDSDPKCVESPNNNSSNVTYHNHTSNDAPSEYVLLPHVLAGTGRLGFFACEGDCSIGRGPQFYRFRNFMVRNALGPERALEFSKQPPVGYITFSLSGATSRPDKVYHFTQEIELARSIYGNNTVKVIDMATLSMVDQIELAANSAVLFTNHGGVGLVSIFLDHGSAVFVYWHNERRFEHNFYESAGYFRTIWVGVEERQYVNRTMALLDVEVRKTALVWPNIVSAVARRHQDRV